MTVSLIGSCSGPVGIATTVLPLDGNVALSLIGSCSGPVGIATTMLPLDGNVALSIPDWHERIGVHLIATHRLC